MEVNRVKVFIAGARSITTVDSYVINKLHSICEKQFDVLVGDCYGVDTVVQSFFANCAYPQVTVYASNGTARNNVGRWMTKNVPADANTKGFEFFRQKDIAMANDADIGFMIWDGVSRGTLHNIISLADQRKAVLVYLHKLQTPIAIHSLDEAEKLMSICDDAAKREYRRLLKDKNAGSKEPTAQLSMFS